MPETVRLSLPQARIRILASQGLGLAESSATTAVERVGWIRTLGGADAYLSLRARCPTVSRAEIDAEVESRQLRVSPAARGCIYLVPRREAGLALRLAARLVAKRNAREQAKAGITETELEHLGETILDALGDGPQSTTDLRRLLPAGSIRSLGEVGKALGLSSTLPVALRRLEFTGRLERLQDNGRLDTERYRWRVAEDDVFAGVPETDAEADISLAEIYCRLAGLATVEGFARWSGLGKRAARAACAALDTVEVEVEGLDAPYFALTRSPSDTALQAAAQAVALLPFQDNLVAVEAGVARLVDASHHEMELPVWGRARSTTLGGAHHAMVRWIVADGRVVGFWELDPDRGAVVVRYFEKLSALWQRKVEAKAAEIGAFLVSDIGHGLHFALDTEAKLSARAERLRDTGRP